MNVEERVQEMRDLMFSVNFYSDLLNGLNNKKYGICLCGNNTNIESLAVRIDKTSEEFVKDFERYEQDFKKLLEKRISDTLIEISGKSLFNEKDYVDFETAKKLKELDYDIPCNSVYDTAKAIDFFSNDNIMADWNHKYHNGQKLEYKFSAPTLTEVQIWLREKYDIWVFPFLRTITPEKDYCCRIYKDGKFLLDKVAYGDDYYECFLDGIKEALKYIKK